jgi:hypothetical protein
VLACLEESFNYEFANVAAALEYVSREHMIVSYQRVEGTYSYDGHIFDIVACHFGICSRSLAIGGESL